MLLVLVMLLLGKNEGMVSSCLLHVHVVEHCLWRYINLRKCMYMYMYGLGRHPAALH